MFKKLCLVLCLVLAVTVGSVWAVEKGQQCTMTVGSKIFLVSPNGDAVSVRTTRDLQITIGEKVTAKGAADLNEAVLGMGKTDMDWTDANLVSVEDGKLAIVRDLSIKDCK